MRSVMLVLTCAMLGLSGCSGSASNGSAPAATTPAPASKDAKNYATGVKDSTSSQGKTESKTSKGSC